MFVPRTFRCRALFDAEGVPGNPPSTPTEPKTGNATDYQAMFEAEAKKALEWQNRFTGLQREYQKQQSEVATLSSQTLDLSKQLQDATGKFETLNIDHGKVKEDLDGRTTELDVLKAQNSRLTTIVTKFPQLIPYLAVKDETTGEVADLLPDETGPELEKKLGLFAAQLAKAGVQNAQSTLMGTPPPPTPQTRTTTVVYQEAMAALAAGKQVEYDNLMNEYYALMGKSSPK